MHDAYSEKPIISLEAKLQCIHLSPQRCRFNACPVRLSGHVGQHYFLDLRYARVYGLLAYFVIYRQTLEHRSTSQYRRDQSNDSHGRAHFRYS